MSTDDKTKSVDSVRKQLFDRINQLVLEAEKELEEIKR